MPQIKIKTLKKQIAQLHAQIHYLEKNAPINPLAILLATDIGANPYRATRLINDTRQYIRSPNSLRLQSIRTIEAHLSQLEAQLDEYLNEQKKADVQTPPHTG